MRNSELKMTETREKEEEFRIPNSALTWLN